MNRKLYINNYSLFFFIHPLWLFTTSQFISVRSDLWVSLCIALWELPRNTSVTCIQRKDEIVWVSKSLKKSLWSLSFFTLKIASNKLMFQETFFPSLRNLPIQFLYLATVLIAEAVFVHIADHSVNILYKRSFCLHDFPRVLGKVQNRTELYCVSVHEFRTVCFGTLGSSSCLGLETI